jgi:GTP-binding protein EngB required for normal cell division
MWKKMVQIEEHGASLTKLVERSHLIDGGANLSQDEEGDASLGSTHLEFQSVVEKVDAIENDIKEMKEKMDSKMHEMKEKIENVGSEMQEMMSKMMGMLAEN